ncbi:metallopeptidase family protein [Zhihengliuella halotolerans]|uniref:Putative Zn-dependent protease with MMP-like domain n=1 Tax=Zhihengliuella halotolerans TaxID=370736 RepID=A0A4V2GA96_9MICC|nr:metallopeptidase family protein [Zhihengliuella halotolerans]RZU63436.1 putative Zn-dependent protease with MMP-like domain [Zhihengliuella halotolerans]
MPFTMDDDAFEDAVTRALDEIPERLRDVMDNVVVFIENRYEPGPGEDPDTVLLGLYDGVPLTERGMDWGEVPMPDRIFIYQEPILQMCDSEEEVVDEVTITVVHEVAHHFGIDDETLHKLGWG